MNEYLLIDSHVLIWLLFEPNMLSSTSRQSLEDAREVSISIASLWELILKHNKGLLRYSPKDIVAGYKVSGISLMGISEEHLLATTKVRLQHKDPFDTILVAQAKVEKTKLLTADRLLLDSPYATIDARP